MATTPNPFVSAMLLFALLITLSFDFTVGEIGIVYGRNGNNLLSPHDVVELYKRHNIRRMRTYDPDSAVLDALRGSGIELSAVITNQFLENLARDQNTANDWVRDHVLNFPDVNYKYISVGNEVSPADGATARYAQFVLPAMRNIYRAICRAGRASQIKITTTVGMSVLGNSYPPEAGAFRDDVVPYLRPILWFITNTGAPFMANIYPYFAYIYNRAQIDLGYALLEPNHGIWINGVYYDNLFYAMVDAVYTAMERMIGGQSESLVKANRTAEHKAAGGRPVQWTCFPEQGGQYNETSEHKARRSKKRPVPYCIRIPSNGSQYNETAEQKAGRSKKWPVPKPKVVAGESGIPSFGNDVANIPNAKTYNQNLVDVVDAGTPRNPEPIETYIFALFDENEKPGDETERHFGLFYPNGQPKYDIDFN